MRYMMIIKANAASEAGVMPTDEEITMMGKYNDELIDAGIMLAGEGLQPSSQGFKVKKEAGKVNVVDGPFTETKELVAGFWIIQVKSHDEAVEWARRVPLGEGEEIEVRKVFETDDFEARDVTRERLEKEHVWREANTQTTPITR